MAKKITIRIVLMLLITVALDQIYRRTFYNADLKRHCPEILKLRKTIPVADLFYFGESSNTTFTEQDSTKKSISELSAGFFPGLHFVNINKEATHAGIYRYWLKEFDKAGKYPRAIIVTTNLRSFDAAWVHSELENSLQQSLVLSSPGLPLVNRFMLSLQAFDNKSAAEREEQIQKEWKKENLIFPFEFPYKSVRSWDDAMAAGGYLLPDGSWDMDKIVLACHYIKAYAFVLNENNPRIRDLDAICDWSFKNKVELYLNLMSENVHYADSLVGKELLFLIRQNRDYIVNRYQKRNCKVVDNLELVKPLEFIDQKWTTEHYVARGRMRIAKNLVDTMRSQFKEEYIKVY